MKLLSKILMVTLVLGSSVLVMNGPVSAVETGEHTGMKYQSRKDDILESSRAIREAQDQYVEGFDWKNSRANRLYPNNRYSLKELQTIVKSVAYVQGHRIRNRWVLLYKKTNLYRLIENHYNEFEIYKDHTDLLLRRDFRALMRIRYKARNNNN